MSYKCLQFILIFCITVPVCAQIYNGDFELIDPNSPLGFNTPLGWEHENYANVTSNFVPKPEKGTTSNWQIDVQKGLNPFGGEFFVVLSTGDIAAPLPDPQYAQIKQRIDVSPGQRVAGVYFFGTCDYIPYEDFATIKLVPTPDSGLRDIILMSISVGDVNSYGSMNNWDFFEYTFGETEAGIYELVLTVSDLGDAIFKSYLAVDNITLCYAPGYGDLNRDCRVDMLDFTLFANDWLSDCSEPNYLADPNNNCWYGTDIDNNGPVDANDLYLMSRFWLDSDTQ